MESILKVGQGDPWFKRQVGGHYTKGDALRLKPFPLA
jgi:hypothetical protein